MALAYYYYISAEKKIYILYGSQTGNSEYIARELHDKLVSENLESVCMAMNFAKKTAPILKTVANFLIIICATTGNGDAPENADAWWRSTKLRSAVSVHFLSFINCINC